MTKTNFKKITIGALALTMIGGSLFVPATKTSKVFAMSSQQMIDSLLQDENTAEKELLHTQRVLHNLLADNARAGANADVSLLHTNADIADAKQAVATAQAQLTAIQNALSDPSKRIGSVEGVPPHLVESVVPAVPLHTAVSTKTGWQKTADRSGHLRWFFFNNDHSLKTNHDWVKYGNYWMFSTGSNGYLTNEWAFIKKSNSTNAKAWFYFDNDGKAVKSGWKKISDRRGHSRWYKFSNYNYDKGSKWVKSGTRWMYIDGNNGYLTNESKFISGKNYHFNNDGYCTNP